MDCEADITTTKFDVKWLLQFPLSLLVLRRLCLSVTQHFSLPQDFQRPACNTSFKAGEQWPGSGCPDVLTTLQWNSSASTEQREGGLSWIAGFGELPPVFAFCLYISLCNHLKIFHDWPKQRPHTESQAGVEWPETLEYCTLGAGLGG